MDGTTGTRSEGSDQESGRVLLRNLRVSGTPLEQSLDRAVAETVSGRVSVAAFGSSI
jgi:hypothetical protein